MDEKVGELVALVAQPVDVAQVLVALTVPVGGATAEGIPLGGIPGALPVGYGAA